MKSKLVIILLLILLSCKSNIEDPTPELNENLLQLDFNPKQFVSIKTDAVEGFKNGDFIIIDGIVFFHTEDPTKWNFRMEEEQFNLQKIDTIFISSSVYKIPNSDRRFSTNSFTITRNLRETLFKIYSTNIVNKIFERNLSTIPLQETSGIIDFRKFNNRSLTIITNKEYPSKITPSE